MGVIYKILKQQRSGMDLSLSSATRCKVQAAIKQRQQQRLLDHNQDTSNDPPQDQSQEHKADLAEEQLQQLCRFLAENAKQKKRQRFLRLQYPCEIPEPSEKDAIEENSDSEQAACKDQFSPHDMEVDFIELPHHHQQQHLSRTSHPGAKSLAAPRDSILLKIRHQIFERKRQRQRQLAELVQQRLVVWRPW
ncbi:hypothetical protein KR018_001404 [Drosophila ironensis]|nr:hypothetical protein KR018_001404 [Drosophila ironensis]